MASVDDAVNACAGGADRLELNVAMELDGLTASVGLFEEVKLSVAVPVVAIVRPRAGGFCYTSRELRSMLRDSETLLASGADGIVSGALDVDGSVDGDFWRSMRRLSEGRQLVFHRAFDVMSDQRSALEELIDLGTTRVLTSGGQETAWNGRSQIAQLQRIADQRIEIIAGSGVSAENAVPLVHATGCRQLHGSFSRRVRESVGSLGEQSYPVTCRQRVAKTRAVLDAAEIE